MAHEKYGSDAHRRQLKLQVLEKYAGEPVTDELCRHIHDDLIDAIKTDFPMATPQVSVIPLGTAAVNITIH